MTSLEALGAAVRQLREARGISREDLEAESGVSVSTQIRLENHGRRINHPNMAALLRALDVDEDEARVLLADQDPRWSQRVLTALSVIDRDEIHGRLGQLAAGDPDLVAMRGDQVVTLRVTSGGEDAARGAGGALRRAGWSVSRPV